MASYDNSDEALYRPVDAEELDALIGAGGRPLLRDAGRLTHFLTRVRTTVADDARKVSGLHRQILEMRDKMGRIGQATTLNPLDAVRWLDDEQLEAAFNRIARQRLAQLRSLVERSERDHTRLAGELERVRAAASWAAQRGDLPVSVRAEFANLLATLPRDVEPPHHPGMLDYPDDVLDPAPSEPATAHDSARPGVAEDPEAAGAPALAPADAASAAGDDVNGGASHPQASPTDAGSGQVRQAGTGTVGAEAVGVETAPTTAPVWVDPWADGGSGPVWRDPFAPATTAPPRSDLATHSVAFGEADLGPFSPASAPAAGDDSTRHLDDSRAAARQEEQR